MNGGVGQGCPSAASAFVIGINPLLTSLHSKIDGASGETISAFADDIAIVLSCVNRLHIMHDVFAEYKLASALSLNFKKTVLVPLASGCPRTAAATIRDKIVGTPLADVSVSTSAVLLGIPVGPRGSVGATILPLRKCSIRCREIADIGLSPVAGHMLARVPRRTCAPPCMPIPPAISGCRPRRANRYARTYSLASPRLRQHYPRNLCVIGLPDILPIDVIVKGIALSAARRYEEFALSCPIRPECAYFSSELRPIASLGLRGPIWASRVHTHRVDGSGIRRHALPQRRDLTHNGLMGPRRPRALS